jgi:hypothetical protein
MTNKIVKIVDEYTIVVSYGYNQGAMTGEILEIFEKGEEIFDPETNESLGTLDFIKGRVRIKNVYDDISLCESYEYTPTESISALLKITANPLGNQRKALNVNTEQISGGYAGNPEICIGDIVRVAVPESKND